MKELFVQKLKPNTQNQKNRRFCSREAAAGKRAKLKSDGMRELKSELVSSFYDQAAHALQLRTCRRRPTLWQATGFVFDGWKIGLSAAKGARPKELRDKSEELRVFRSKR